MSFCLHPPDGRCRICCPTLQEANPEDLKQLHDCVLELLQSGDGRPKALQQQDEQEEEEEEEEEQLQGERVKLQAYEHGKEGLSQASLGQVNASTCKEKGSCISKSQKKGSPLLLKSAEDLQEGFKEFEALLARSGETPDAAIRERLKLISTGLASIALDDKKPQEDKNLGRVEFHLNASMLEGSVGTFRDAHVDFEERHIIIRAVDCGGNAWTLRSNRLPGNIVKDESRFMLSTNGKDLRITLKKGNALAPWNEGDIVLSEIYVPRRSSSNTRSNKSARSNQNQKSRVLIHNYQKSAACSSSSATGCTTGSACGSSPNHSVHIHGCKAPANLATSSEKALTEEEEAEREKAGAAFF